MSSEDTSSGGCCGCGQKRETTRICMCLPYKDGFMISAQIISIVPFLIPWVWWVTWFVGFICFVVLQVIWCCRQSKIGLYISAGISMLAGITSTIDGIVMIFVWRDQARFFPLIINYGSDDYYDYFYDEWQTWAAFVTAALWFSTSGLILYFVGSGRYAMWEEEAKLRGASDTTPTTTTATPTAIEMGAIQHQHDDQHQQEQQTTTTGTYSVATAAAATTAIDHDHDHTTYSTAGSYVLPGISNKVDNV